MRAALDSSNSSKGNMEAQVGPQRTSRVTRACDRCHRTNTKCAPSSAPSTCQPCSEFRAACTYNRPVQRRGPKPSSESASAKAGALVYPVHQVRSILQDSPPSNSQWVYKPLADQDTILELVHVYHSIAYPIFPLFHWPTFVSLVQGGRYMTDRALCSTVMAVCAIVMGRRKTPADAQAPHCQTPSPCAEMRSSRAFYEAAVGAFPRDLSTAQGFEFKRAKVLMAIASIQSGAILEHQTHLGEYVVLAGNDGFQDEARWERDLTEIQRQERRRLFWSAYTLEVFSAITWDGTVRFRERQINVAYPAAVYDEDISENGIAPRIDSSFLEGWNHTSDMYRVLEHLVGRLKDRRRVPDAISAMFSTPGPSAAEILGHLEGQFNRLPAVYRSARVMTGDDRQDSFGFQAANIAITLQTVKLALAGTENQSVGRKCEIAGELLDVLAAIPTSYIVAISTPMLHHLASCGHLLANIVQGRLSQWAMIQVRNVLIAMIGLLSGLEQSLSLGSDVAVKLRGHVAQIETYMEQAAVTARQSQVFHSVVPRYSPDRSDQTSNGNSRNTPGPELTDSDSGHDLLFPGNLDLWSNDFIFDWPSDHQTALQADLTENWPFDFGGGVTDLLGLGTADLLDNAVQGGIQAEANPSSSLGI